MDKYSKNWGFTLFDPTDDALLHLRKLCLIFLVHGSYEKEGLFYKPHIQGYMELMYPITYTQLKFMLPGFFIYEATGSRLENYFFCSASAMAIVALGSKSAEVITMPRSLANSKIFAK